MRWKSMMGSALALLLWSGTAGAEVLGPCGTPSADEPAEEAATAAPAASAAPAQQVSRVPLPGEKAPNFELAAVVGDEVKTIRLSDFDGQWRVVCFYPADFTFV